MGGEPKIAINRFRTDRAAAIDVGRGVRPAYCGEVIIGDIMSIYVCMLKWSVMLSGVHNTGTGIVPNEELVQTHTSSTKFVETVQQASND